MPPMLFLRTFLAFRKEKTQEKKTMNCPFRTDEMKGLFKMRYSKKEFEKYPEIMNKEQLRTALFLLQFNLIPHNQLREKDPLLRHQEKRCNCIYKRQGEKSRTIHSARQLVQIRRQQSEAV